MKTILCFGFNAAFTCARSNSAVGAVSTSGRSKRLGQPGPALAKLSGGQHQHLVPGEVNSKTDASMAPSRARQSTPPPSFFVPTNT